jgi:hypothetical protein
MHPERFGGMLWNIPQLVEERLHLFFPPKAHHTSFVTWARKYPSNTL